jgi:inner membrane protein
MDSLTHLFLGGAIAAAIAPAKYRRAALLAGAAINTLPDLDVLPLALVEDPVMVMTWHRGATHSLLVLPWVAGLLWWLLKSRWKPVRESPTRWFWLIMATLLAHPLIDAFTVYGTQLFWPLPMAPAMWSSLFIIDPLFTLPLVLACIAAWWLRERPAAQRALLAGLVLSCAYVAWSQVAKWKVDSIAESSLAGLGLQDAPRITTPMPFNTLLWRVVVMTPDGFMESERSLVADSGPMRFVEHPSDTDGLAATAAYPAVRELRWFTHGFLKAQRHEGELVLADLRMGAEPDYSFRFVVARTDADGWQPIPPRQLKWPRQASERLPGMWDRIWRAPSASGVR